MKLSDRTGSVPRMVGVVGVVFLVVTVLVLPEPTPEPAPRPAEPAMATPEVTVADRADPQRLRESSRVRRLVPVFPGSTFTPMGLLEANGNKMEMGFFEAKASLNEVLDFYNREFGKRGRKVVEQPAPNGGAMVNYYDDTIGALVAVTVTPKGSAKAPRVLVFPSVTAAPDGIFLKAQAPERLPQPEGVMTVMRVDDHSVGPSQGSTTLTQVAPGTPGQLAAYYRKEMGSRGYAVISGRSVVNTEVLEFERSGERISLSISPMAKDGAAESVITVVTENTARSKGT